MKGFLKIMRRAVCALWCLVFIGGLVAGCASLKQPTFSALPADLTSIEDFNPTKAPLAIGDIVVVKISRKSEQVPAHQETIKEDGNITLPFIGDLKAAGKTVLEFQKEIHDRYASITLRNWVVNVEKQQCYYVIGQVRQPGRQIYAGPITVIKAIESAGGLTEFAGRATRVHLARTSGRIFVINCVKAAKDPSFDLPVYPGDRIDVPMQYVPDYFRFE